MTYFLGIDVGAARTVAAVARPGPGDPDTLDGVETVDLGDAAEEVGVASVLHLGADGVLAVGAAARARALAEPERVVSGFPGCVGDDAMLVAGEPWAPEELTAWLVRWVVDRVTEREGGPAAAVAVAHPASWGADRTRLLAAAVAEEDLDVTFLAPAPAADDPPSTAGGGSGGRDAAARAAAVALRTAASVGSSAGTGRSVDVVGSGRHAVVGAAESSPAESGPAESSPHEPSLAAPSTDEPSTDEPGTDESSTGTRVADGPAGTRADEPGAGDADRDPPGPTTAAPGDDPDAGSSGDPPEPDPDWEVPAPRSHRSGGYAADPATANLVADLVGFTGGMGATNTAGLLSGYTPPHGIPTTWSGTHAAGAAVAPAGTATGRAVALPAQRSDSGRWGAVATAGAAAPAWAAESPRPVAAPRARHNPAVLVGVGGLSAVVAVVGALFLWPGPRTADTASSRPVAVVPVAPTFAPAAPTVALTPVAEPSPPHRSRPSAPRTRRPVAPPTAVVSTAPTTPPPTKGGDPTEPAEPTTSTPPSREESAPPTTTADD